MRHQRILILLDLSGVYGRGVLNGIGQLARVQRRWLLEVHPPDVATVDALREWRPDGVIVQLRTDALVAGVAELGVPTINVSGVLARSPVPRVMPDSRAVGRLAGEYFAERGFRSVAFAAYDRTAFAVDREAALRQTAAARGMAYGDHWGGGVHLAAAGAAVDPLADWMRSLPKPVGILAANDGWALRLLEVARQVGLDVPGDVAVVGVDNDSLVCELARPPVSSIELPMTRIGHDAAIMLRDLLAGITPVDPDVRLAPVRVVTRQSSDVLAIHDRDLAQALKFIRDHAHRPIRADEVARGVAVSRRSLERRFRSILGRTLLDEIHRAHVEEAKRLLVHTDMPMPAVAEAAGFSNERLLSSVFRATIGTTPGTFRRRYRLRG